MSIHPDSAIIITGAGQGIGREMALKIVEQYSNPLILIARTESKLEETAKLCKKAGSGEVHVFPCDLADKLQVTALVTDAVFKTASVLINNAGSYLEKNVLDSEPEDFESQMASNFYAAVYITQHLLETLKSQNEAKLIFTCSVTAKKGQARCGAYSAAKNSLNGYIQSLREALLDSGVAVTSLILGQTWSPSWDEVDIDPNRLIDPADVGMVTANLLGLSSRTCVEEIVIRPQKGDVG